MKKLLESFLEGRQHIHVEVLAWNVQGTEVFVDFTYEGYPENNYKINIWDLLVHVNNKIN